MFISNSKAMKLLIKKLKIENYLWGCKRIQNELEKISIDISREAIEEYYNFVVLVRLIVGIDQNNQYRPHQGIHSIPEGKPLDVSGNIMKKSILYGLHHHYYRAS